MGSMCFSRRTSRTARNTAKSRSCDMKIFICASSDIPHESSAAVTFWVWNFLVSSISSFMLKSNRVGLCGQNASTSIRCARVHWNLINVFTTEEYYENVGRTFGEFTLICCIPDSFSFFFIHKILTLNVPMIIASIKSKDGKNSWYFNRLADILSIIINCRSPWKCYVKFIVGSRSKFSGQKVLRLRSGCSVRRN